MDTETIEALADPRIRNSRSETEQSGAKGEFEGGEGEGREQDVARVSGAAAGVLRFSEERDPFALTQFVRLRIIDPEGAYWRRGIEAATKWLRETGNVELRVPYVFVAPAEWGAVGGYPLGRWIGEQRRYYAAGILEAKRVVELEALGMVWSAWETAWAEGLAVAQEWAACDITRSPTEPNYVIVHRGNCRGQYRVTSESGWVAKPAATTPGQAAVGSWSHADGRP
ncbi:helicase associated domain-containing protein [Streptomyces olivochromogenes]|uniref:Helicase n=1 Tax=Streptomyces olivochromogenes TaxID=1963 RepID=A0A250VQE5_STROL|nr:helicase associated domain-containing protein [Streptomyces olivochromogenes]KUN39420.1 hypothetical protein AQJ27_42915 [Streptomyces olivochromogenes]GAX56417.1 helicase [Streptomyces olivochromogenes]